MGKEKDLFGSNCEHDYKNKHRWESKGVISDKYGTVWEVFKCSQCCKIISEELEELK